MNRRALSMVLKRTNRKRTEDERLKLLAETGVDVYAYAKWSCGGSFGPVFDEMEQGGKPFLPPELPKNPPKIPNDYPRG